MAERAFDLFLCIIYIQKLFTGKNNGWRQLGSSDVFAGHLFLIFSCLFSFFLFFPPFQHLRFPLKGIGSQPSTFMQFLTVALGNPPLFYSVFL